MSPSAYFRQVRRNGGVVWCGVREGKGECMGAFKDRITSRILEICLGFRFEIETEVRL
jgi:hypothetical protein